MKSTRIRRRCLLPLSCVLLPFVCLAGCANFQETRAIEAFTRALQDENLDELKERTSNRFEQKALRLAESIDDFAVLRLPKGDVEVLDVEDLSDVEKRVTVKIGKSDEKLRYRLLREAGSRKWVVDDIYLKKKKDGIVSTKPVTELMDLVTTVREFLAAWSGGDRNEILEVATPHLGELLASLPRSYLNYLADRVIGDRAGETRIRPEAQMDDDVAVVRLPRKSGQMIISFEKTDGHWLVSDLAVESRKDNQHVSSVVQFATVLDSAAKFLDAYNKDDKAALASVTDKSFFEHSLEPARLESVPLPTAESSAGDFQVKLENGIADLLIPTSTELIKLSLIRIDSEDAATRDRYLVDDVTLYELDGNEEKRLSALFLSHAMVELFAESLSLRDLQSVRLMSTPDFRQRIWSLPGMDERLMMRLPMPEVENAVPQVQTTVFMGPVTEVTVRQGSRNLIYVLQDSNGELLIDDVLLPVFGRPNSLKVTFDAMIPVYLFAQALQSADRPQLHVLSSRDLNTTVWHATEQIPMIGVNPIEYLQAPLTSMEQTDRQTVLRLGDDRFGAQILLNREGGQLVVDDMRLISGPELRQRVDLKEAMKIEIARQRGDRRVQTQR
ncbi:hypothetical protein GC176_22335 [bacterium]|nr:hypothetical protein [bacterium]